MAHNFTHFQPYDILEPTKAVNPHCDVGILIDINNEHGTQNDLQLSGSDLDSIKKAEFDLVDLYENIYVTPQHVKKQEEVVDIPHIDYSEFLKKMEARKEVNRTSNPNDSPLNVNKHEIDSISEDEICLEKADKLTSKFFCTSVLNSCEITKVLKVPTLNDQGREINHGICKKINSICYNTNKLVNNKSIDDDEFKGMVNVTKDLSSTTFDINKLKAMTGVSSIDGSFKGYHVAMLGKTLKDVHLNKTSCQEPIRNQNILQNGGTKKICNKNLSTVDTYIVKTVTLDKKIYNKQRQVRDESEKSGYTKGPDLYEKSVVLPQIMKRLGERKDAQEEDSKLRRKLILDSSKQPQCKCQSQKPAPKPIKEVNVNTKFNEPLIHTSTSKKEPPLDQYTQEDYIKLNPIVALENCNRERLIANRVHSAFQKYILTGKYY